jgi:exodeoxyribonuclease-5
MTHTEKAIAEQELAIKKLNMFLSNPSINEILFTGPAGTGKTKLIIDLILNKQININTTMFSAISNKALEVLKSRFETVDQLKLYINNFKTISYVLDRVPKFDNNGKIYFGKSLTARNISNRIDLLIVDECSMIDDNSYYDLLKFARKKNCKLMFVGDDYQCPPPSGKKSSKVFSIKNHVKLYTPFRYGDDINTIVTDVRNAIDKNIKSHELIKSLKDKSSNSSCVQFYDNKKQFIQQAIDSYKNNKNISVLAYRNETVKNIAEYIRENIIENVEHSYCKGDILICQGNYGSLLSNQDNLIVSEMYKVENINTMSISIALDNDNKIISKNSLADNPFLGFDKDNHKITFIIKGFILNLHKIDDVNKKTMCVVPNSSTSKYYNQYKKLIIECLEYDSNTKGSLINLFHDMNYGYSINIYKAQGSTYDEIYIYLDDIINLKPVDLKDKYKALYTAMTRAKNKVHILLTK